MDAERASANRLINALIRERIDPHLPWATTPVTVTGRRVLATNADIWQHLLTNPVLTEEVREELRESAAGEGQGAELPTAPSTVEWVQEQRSTNPHFSPLAFFEQSVRSGHQLHPTSRIRHGMSVDEITAYAPEWAPTVELAIVAIKHTHLHDRGMTAALLREHPSQSQSALADIQALGEDAEQYGLLPVHPWQVRHRLSTQFRAELDAREIIITTHTIPTQPLLSTRTMRPLNGASHLKTAIGVRLTGAIRGVSPQAAANGIAVSSLLNTLNVDGLHILTEQASASFIDHTEANREFMLGAIARTNPERHHTDLTLPVAALRAESPITKKPLLNELETATFATDYAELVLPPLLTLVTKYGIALEAHAQNTLVTLKERKPDRITYRDFGAIRISPQRLANHGHVIELAPGSALTADNDDDLRNRLSYSLIQDHLGELLPALAAQTGQPEIELWRPFVETARATFARLRQCCSSCLRAADEDEAFFFAETAPLKAHLRARLAGATHQAQYIPVENPFHLVENGKASQPIASETERFVQEEHPELIANFRAQLPIARIITAQRVRDTCARENLVLDLSRWDRVQQEAENSAQNLALARANLHAQKPATANDISGENVQEERFSAQGHNLHPLSRARLGFSPGDNFAYPAEGAGSVELRLVAVHRDLLRHTPTPTGQNVSELVLEQLDLTSRVREAMNTQALDPNTFDVIPLHPWQCAHALPASYPAELAARTIVPLDVTIPAIPSASMRTLATEPGHNGQRLMIKTAIAAQVTTTIRNISPASTQNGPRLSRVMETIVEREPHLNGRVSALVEHAGVCFSETATPDLPGPQQRERNLSVIVREDLSRHVSPGDRVLTGCVFYAENPATGRPFLLNVVQQRAALAGLNLSKAGLALWDEYAGLLINTILTFLTRYGVGLEAHLQNSLVVVNQARITRLLLRDFAGVRIHHTRLTQAGIDFTPAPGSITFTDDMREVYRKTFHAAILANLAEVARTLSDVVSPTTLWERARSLVEETFVILAASERTSREGIAADRAAIFAPKLDHKAFLRMRLFEPSHPEFATYWPTPNPLVS
ncbi:MAG: hypothetical protein HOQ05_06105 [Corynebacteriales bacterium]|nr:hypothetical protein [Mycobacteriales bacterium]